MREDNRRARVQPRQAYCYAVAGKLNWDGPWREAVDHGLAWFESVYKRSDGLYGALASAEGHLLDSTFDLYNHSFALFGLASAAIALPERFLEYHLRALEIITQLKVQYANPLGGFQTTSPPQPPLCSNPHMHMFEAALAWEVAAPDEPVWSDLADEIANLALTRMIDGDTGALREFFDLEWQPLPGQQGRLVEPGHQFEWAWLLTLWSDRRKNTNALMVARRLFDIAERHGLCPVRNVAVMSLNDDFTVHSDLARLWSQTEWLKSAVRLAAKSEGPARERYLKSAVSATRALGFFLNRTSFGLWCDKWPMGSKLVDEPAPASTFYHIVAAGEELRESPFALTSDM
jgi:mannose-6-phosphate isomerase